MNGETPESMEEGYWLGKIFYWLLMLFALLAALLLLAVVALGVAWVFHLLIGLFP